MITHSNKEGAKTAVERIREHLEHTNFTFRNITTAELLPASELQNFVPRFTQTGML